MASVAVRQIGLQAPTVRDARRRAPLLPDFGFQLASARQAQCGLRASLGAAAGARHDRRPRSATQARRRL